MSWMKRRLLLLRVHHQYTSNIAFSSPLHQIQSRAAQKNNTVAGNDFSSPARAT
jgi:hypothetical protein